MSSASLPIAREVFNFVFFIVSVIILMNLLIAMYATPAHPSRMPADLSDAACHARMSNTFNSIYEQADENYRLQFAKMVREYFDANVLPPPLNILELCLNRCMRRKMAASRWNTEMGSLKDTLSHSWGQHYLWPVPPIRYHLPLAMQSFKAAQKDHSQVSVRSMACGCAMSRLSNRADSAPVRTAGVESDFAQAGRAAAEGSRARQRRVNAL